MATYAARKLAELALNVRHIVAIELMAATQGIDFHRPMTSSESLESVHALLRSRVPFLHEDRVLAPDIAAIEDLIQSDALTSFASSILPSQSA